MQLLGDFSTEAEILQLGAALCGMLAAHASNAAAVAAAGAIPRLVRFLAPVEQWGLALKPGVPASVQKNAAAALCDLAQYDEIKRVIANAGGIPALVRLLGAGSSCPQTAAAALFNLAEDAEHAVSVAAAGAITPLVQALGPQQYLTWGSPACLLCVRESAKVLWSLAKNSWNAVAIVIAGAVPRLVRLLGPSTPFVHGLATDALWNLAHNDTDSARAICDAGGIPALAQLLRSRSSDFDLKTAATRVLWAISDNCHDAEIRAIIDKVPTIFASRQAAGSYPMGSRSRVWGGAWGGHD